MEPPKLEEENNYSINAALSEFYENIKRVQEEHADGLDEAEQLGAEEELGLMNEESYGGSFEQNDYVNE